MRSRIVPTSSPRSLTTPRARSACAWKSRNNIPDLKLGPGYKLDQNENKWTLGIGFELPILNQHKGAIAEAEGRRAEAAARFHAVQARALAEIDVALAVYRAARAKAEAAGASGRRRAGADEEPPKR